ncbi:MAG TPA: pyruvate kinase [Chloroflexaceae bacterium]|nr:pyruvate kinase [Chloroflexaceae bacterium]
MRRTKIVATLGPATSTPEQIGALIAAGMNVARLNFSHGTQEEHGRTIAAVREAAGRLGRPVAIMQDLQGLKIRTGPLAGGGPVELEPGEVFAITTRQVPGSAQEVSTSYQELPRDVRPGEALLVSDGLLELVIEEVSGDTVRTRVVHGGALREHQGINLPATAVSAPVLTPKDRDDLRFGLAQGVDYVAVSFVRRAADVRQVAELIADAGHDTPIVAKIEKPQALDELEQILELVGGVMVARGDLGVEMPLEQVPTIQKELIAEANCRGVPVITATQMLESMVRNPRPTRAEASDVANAIYDGTDAVMLSAESAIGAFPAAAVTMMARIAAHADGRRGQHAKPPPSKMWPPAVSVAGVIGQAAGAVTGTPPIRAVVALTRTGNTARLIAHLRPPVPILALTPYEHICRRLSLVWGVTPVRADYDDDLAAVERTVNGLVQAHGLAQPGDWIVLTGGHPLTRHATTNFLKVIQVAAAGHAADHES